MASELKFEEALRRLESIVQELEEGQLDLETSLQRFEEGVKLARFCGKKLDEAERKVEILLRDEGGGPQWQPFEAEEIPPEKEDA